MSARTALLPTSHLFVSTLSPLIRGVVFGQSHRIPVRVHLDGMSVPATLLALDERRAMLELLPGTYVQGTGEVSIGLTYGQCLHRPAVPVWRTASWVSTATTSLTVNLLGERPDCLSRQVEHADRVLSASATSPVFFNRRLTVQVGQLSPLAGELRVLGDDPGVMPGMDLELHFNCRWSGACRVRVQVLELYEWQGRRTCYFRVLDLASSQAVALMLLCHREAFTFDSLPAALRKSRAVDRLISVSIVETPRRLEEVLACRLAANRHYGRLGKVEDAQSLWDDFDPFSIQVSARLGRKCVGAGRVVINEGHRQRCEIEVSTPLPSWLWEGGFVEMSRVAIKPEYSGHRVMLALLRELGRITLFLRCRYIVLDAIELLVPIYTRLGARCLPISKQHPYSGERVRIMYFDVGQLLSSVDRGLPHWLYVFGPTIEHSISSQSVRDVAATLRVSATRLHVKRSLASALKKILG
ncbi:hypothetical protein [Pseudomonas sp. MWU13-2105]|uniref:hypothetical protein n=1 Tax=Pseudomonas sp. MWU13-2105 TaxID=2935074 RepID=UPI00200D5E09|nr:hypothetical protein [Pseudomonas sp. MWU13-2105]